ncbi:hypothetical protein [Streptomyces natalensis]|uniref:hypothetical protein n=1 Tax=Streptomyces natalensis TaxID=68242 RepID=UPI000B0996D4|nr:hypothetical protein [Streptomyces natalensis]
MAPAVLRFTANGPAVTEEWAAEATARRTWRDWIGLYGSDENVLVRLIEDTGDRERA